MAVAVLAAILSPAAFIAAVGEQAAELVYMVKALMVLAVRLEVLVLAVLAVAVVGELLVAVGVVVQAVGEQGAGVTASYTAVGTLTMPVVQVDAVQSELSGALVVLGARRHSHQPMLALNFLD